MNIIPFAPIEPQLSPTLLGEMAAVIMMEAERRGEHIDSTTALEMAKRAMLEFLHQSTEAADHVQEAGNIGPFA